jgi:hypothetical protein
MILISNLAVELSVISIFTHFQQGMMVLITYACMSMKSFIIKGHEN